MRSSDIPRLGRYMKRKCNTRQTGAHITPLPLFISFLLSRRSPLPLPYPPRDIRLGLLHGVELEIPCHRPRVLAMLIHEPLQPLDLPLRQGARLLDDGPVGLDFQLRDDAASFSFLDAAPLLARFHLLVLVGIQLIERIIQRVLPLLLPIEHAHDLPVGVALDAHLAHDGAGELADREGVDGLRRPPLLLAARRGVGLHAAGGGFQPGDEAEALVVLRCGFFFVPVVRGSDVCLAWELPCAMPCCDMASGDGIGKDWVVGLLACLPVLCDNVVPQWVEQPLRLHGR